MYNFNFFVHLFALCKRFILIDILGVNGGGGLGDTDEHVEVESEGDNNEEGGENGEATGAEATGNLVPCSKKLSCMQ